MSTLFFDDATRLGVLGRASHAWRGTPFRANSESCGARGGVCCHLLVWHVYREAGVAIPRPPLGPPGHARFNRVSLMEPWLDGCPQFVRLSMSVESAAGDLLGFNMGGAIHHLGILIAGGQFVHAIHGAGVVISPVDDPTWASRLVAKWRPVA